MSVNRSISRDVLIADNFIHDITAWHTDGITIFNAEDVVIRGNRISDLGWTAINLHTWKYMVSRVAIKDNTITRAFDMAHRQHPGPMNDHATHL